MEAGEKITSGELRNLVDLCNFCALCPCPPVRANIIEAKTRFVDRDGLKFGVRTLEDVERVAKLCGAIPRLSNNFFLQQVGRRSFEKGCRNSSAAAPSKVPRKKFPAMG